MTVSEELDLLLNTATTIPSEKRYWMIRTQSGSLYENFRELGFIALEHNEISYFDLHDFKNNFSDSKRKLLAAIRKMVRNAHESQIPIDSDEEVNVRKAGLIASQIYKFAYGINQGDTVVIPSYNSDVVSFGIVQEEFIASLSPEERRKVGTEAILIKRVKWIKDINRRQLDPYLYRMFTAHQALNDVSGYAGIIERSLRDFFILDDEAHLIINVETENEIPAGDLFGLGSEILGLIDRFAEAYNLDISSRDLQVSVNVNSPGKIDLKSKIRKTTFVAGIILFTFGGGYEDKAGHQLKTPGIPGLLKAIDEFRKHEQERAMKQKIFDQYKDSLQVKSVDDINKLFKQFSDNKDVPK